MLTSANKVSSLLTFCSGILLASVVIWLVVMPAAQRKLEAQAQTHLEGSAKLTSRLILEATFEVDLAKMQFQLQEALTQLHVNSFAVYDVENNLLVHAGSRNSSNVATDTVIHPITIDNTLAGYLTATANKPQLFSPAANSLLISWMIILIGIICWLTYEAHGNQILQTARNLAQKYFHKIKPKNEPHAAQQIDPKSETLDNHHESGENTVIAPLTYVTIFIRNHSVLKQQLSGSSYQKLNRQLIDTLNSVVGLYNGEVMEVESTHIRLGFSETSGTAESVFRAICGAYLALELCGIVNNIPLDLSAIVSNNNETTAPNATGLFINQYLQTLADLHSKIETLVADTDCEYCLIKAFQPSLQALLDKQRGQLAEIL